MITKESAIWTNSLLAINTDDFNRLVVNLTHVLSWNLWCWLWWTTYLAHVATGAHADCFPRDTGIFAHGGCRSRSFLDHGHSSLSESSRHYWLFKLLCDSYWGFLYFLFFLLFSILLSHLEKCEVLWIIFGSFLSANGCPIKNKIIQNDVR